MPLLSVCSTTLWVGHLSKLVYQEELSDTFGEYGDIVSIDQIVPRGCAFIVMNRRQDAHKAMQALKNHKLQGRAITISMGRRQGCEKQGVEGLLGPRIGCYLHSLVQTQFGYGLRRVGGGWYVRRRYYAHPNEAED